MPLEVRYCEGADFAELFRIQLAAFNTGMTNLLKPWPVTQEYTESSIEKHIASAANEPDCHFLKVVDTDQGDKILGVAKWRINERERTEEQIQVMLPVPTEEEEEKLPAAKDFKNYLTRVRRQFMGTKPFYFLHMLVVDPEYQRRGVGDMLVKWGIEKADKVQLPSFLEASEVGKGLYLKNGFEAVNEEIFDLSKYGRKGIEVNTAMIRQPKKA